MFISHQHHHASALGACVWSWPTRHCAMNVAVRALFVSARFGKETTP